MRVRRRAIFRIDGHELVGERLRVDGHFSRTGIQVYDDGFGREQREYRPPEEVFSTDSLASLRAMPVTISHPEDMITAESWHEHAVGQTGDVIIQDIDGIHTLGTVWLHDVSAIRSVQTGRLIELSVGYFASLDMTPGTTSGGEGYDGVQRDIRGNHLALLPPGHARGGPTVRLLDGVEQVVRRLDAKQNEIWGPGPIEPRGSTTPKATYQSPRLDADAGDIHMSKQSVKADGLPFEVEAADNFGIALERERSAAQAKLDAIEQHAKDTKASLDAAEAKASEVEAERDTLKEQVAKLEADLVDATDPKRLTDRVESLARLAADARKVGGEGLKLTRTETLADGKTREVPLEGIDLKRAALEGAGVVLDGKDDAYVEHRFGFALEIGGERQNSTDALDRLRTAIVAPPHKDKLTDSTDAQPISIDEIVARGGY